MAGRDNGDGSGEGCRGRRGWSFPILPGRAASSASGTVAPRLERLKFRQMAEVSLPVRDLPSDPLQLHRDEEAHSAISSEAGLGVSSCQLRQAEGALWACLWAGPVGLEANPRRMCQNFGELFALPLSYEGLRWSPLRRGMYLISFMPLEH
jgi:hypothetical protein